MKTLNSRSFYEKQNGCQKVDIFLIYIATLSVALVHQLKHPTWLSLGPWVTMSTLVSLAPVAAPVSVHAGDPWHAGRPRWTLHTLAELPAFVYSVVVVYVADCSRDVDICAEKQDRYSCCLFHNCH